MSDNITIWRLLATESADGATNMAADEAIIQSVAADGRPVLRFYQWSQPCISLGYAQSAAIIDHAACQVNGWNIVRRLTGGRAVLHEHEITYMLCVPESDPCVHGGVLASYKRISTGLAAGLSRLGIGLEAAAATARGDQQAMACFDTPSASEIVFRGRKLLGSAQTRRNGVVMQHGSLPLSGDVGLLADGLMLTEEIRVDLKRQLRQQAATLAYALGCTPDPVQVTAALTNGLAKTLDITFMPDKLTDLERQRTMELRADKYANARWTQRR